MNSSRNGSRIEDGDPGRLQWVGDPALVRAAKLHHAKALRDELGVSRPILVDDLEGSCHRAWGMLPNMAWIVLRGGTIGYKADWTDPLDVAGAAEQLLDDQGSGKTPFYNERLRHRTQDRAAFMRGLERNGPKAIEDFKR